MNRIEFMNQLEQLLVDIPADEKQEALEFYTNYFEDAGEENEDQILRELGSPERVARTIKDDLSANGEYSKNGEYTEHGYKDASDSKESIIKVEPSAKEQQTTEGNTENKSGSYVNLNKESQNQSANAQNEQQNQNNNGYGQNQNQYQNQGGYGPGQNQGGFNQQQNQNGQYQYQYGNQNGYGQNPYQNQNGYGQNPYQNQGGYAQNQNAYEKPAKTNVPLLILICIFAVPCIIPIAVTCFCTVFGLVIGFGAAGVGCTAAGIAVALCGIVEIASVPAIGIVAIGGGLICFGLGILFFFVTIAIAKLIPAVCRAIGAIFRAPFGGRRVAA